MADIIDNPNSEAVLWPCLSKVLVNSHDLGGCGILGA